MLINVSFIKQKKYVSTYKKIEGLNLIPILCRRKFDCHFCHTLYIFVLEFIYLDSF